MKKPENIEGDYLMKPLEGFRVLDLSQYIAGPYCSLLLETFGAEVVKIESPKGDDARSWPPIKEGFSGYFANYNGGKKSVTLDLKDTSDRAILFKLISKCDILIHNFTGHTREKLGMTYEDVVKYNDKIIYCNISGWGAEGPYKDRKGFDTIFQAVSGVTYLTGEQGRDPVKCGVPIGDVSGGMFAAMSILAAVVKKQQTGEGENIDLSMVDGLYNFLPVSAAFYSFNGKTPDRMGSGHVGKVPSQVFKCGDGKFAQISINDGQWGKLCDVLGIEEWRDSEFYSKNLNRLKCREEVVNRINEALSTMDRDTLAQKCFEAGVPCGEVKSIEDIEADPQAIFRNSIEKVDYGDVKMRFFNYPARFKDIDISVDRTIPGIGEHNEEIFSEWLGE